MFELLKDAAKLALIIASLYFALSYYAQRERSVWSRALLARRMTLLGLSTLVLILIKVMEDVLGQESGLFDRTVLLFVHRQFGTDQKRFFDAVSVSASFGCVLSLAAAAGVALLIARRRFEALLISGSTLTAGCSIWALKAVIGRGRPELWASDWYWGSSFPSGHTLAAAAFGTAIVLVVRRIRPRWQTAALLSATSWIFLVGLSRLVLGVHWPTDVIAAVCIGTLIPLCICVVDDLSGHRGGR